MTTKKPVGDLYAWKRALRGQVSIRALGVALVLSTYMDQDGTVPARFNPGLDKIAADCGYAGTARKSVTPLIKELEDTGFLAVRRTGGGKHVVNHYTATIPLAAPHTVPDREQYGDDTTTETVPVRQQKEADTVPARDANCTDSGTHPSLPSQSPSQGDVAGAAKPNSSASGATNDAKRTASRVLRGRVLPQLAPEEARQLNDSLAQLRPVTRDRMATQMHKLVTNGWEDMLVEELTRSERDWSTPYGGCTSPGAAAAARVKSLAGKYTRKRQSRAAVVKLAIGRDRLA